jgi:hypothetical protein
VPARATRRIVFSIVFSRQRSPALLFFQFTKIETNFLSANSILEFSHSQDPLRTLPIRAFEWNHCKLDEIDQDMLEYLYSGAALS